MFPRLRSLIPGFSQPRITVTLQPKPESVLVDQGGSLAHALRAAGLAHGDEADVALTRVGITSPQSGVMLSFCPSRARLLAVHKLGSDDERRCPLPEAVTLEAAVVEIIKQHLRGKRGFAHFQTRIITNGSIRIKELALTGFEHVPAYAVTRPESYVLHGQQR